MPIIHFRGRELIVAPGTRLRDALRAAGESPHNGRAKFVNCKGFGTCGTCSLVVTSGSVSPTERTARERVRLSFFPYESERSESLGLRLACQVRTTDEDLTVEKRDGFWGQGDTPT